MILSERLLRNLASTNIKPILVWQIEGIDTLYTSSGIKEVIRYGDPGLEYGDAGIVYGGLRRIENQLELISLDGTTTSIKQTLDTDKGRGSGITQMTMVLIDKNLEATKLAAGLTYGEILYKKCKVWIGFNESSNFNTDYILIFRGLVESVKSGQGKVSFNLSSPDDKKRQAILLKEDLQLDGGIDNNQTTILLNSINGLFNIPDHPAYTPKDTSIKTHVIVEEEIVTYDRVSGTVDDTAVVTVSIASPAIISEAAHTRQNGDALILTSTGALPTGFTTGLTYFVQNVIAGVSYQLAATFGGLSVNTSGIQSGVHSVKSAMALLGCTRGAFLTTNVLHDDATQVDPLFELQGNAMDLALKVMLSDPEQLPYLEELEATAVNYDGNGPVQNAIYFQGINFARDYNVQIGDFVKTILFTPSGNNFSVYREIVDVVLLDSGSYIVVDPDDGLLTDEPIATGKVTFLSQYNSLGFGLGMDTDEIDIEKHLLFKRNYLTSFNYRFFIKEEIASGKEWIEKELYVPASCYSLPADREGLARVSVGIHKPPLPNQGITTLDQTNITNPDKLEVQRSANKNYFNAVLYRYEDTPLLKDFTRRVFEVSGTQQIKTGNRAKVIDSNGLKEVFNAKILAIQSAERILQRYETAAEYISAIQVNMKTGVQIAVGDILILDPAGLNMINPETGKRDRPPQLMEVTNKTLDVKTGKATLDVINTAFNVNAKYGLISASSLIGSVISQKIFVIGPMLPGSKYGSNEYRKWNGLKHPAVKIRKADWSQVFETTIEKVSFNTIELTDDVDFTLTGGEIMELANYSNAATTDQVKLIYAFLSDGANDFPDGEPPYVFA